MVHLWYTYDMNITQSNVPGVAWPIADAAQYGSKKNVNRRIHSCAAGTLSSSRIYRTFDMQKHAEQFPWGHWVVNGNLVAASFLGRLPFRTLPSFAALHPIQSIMTLCRISGMKMM